MFFFDQCVSENLIASWNVLLWVGPRNPSRVADMAEELSITPAKASTFCAELHDIGLVKKDGAVRNPENTGRNLILWRWR